jgi:non-homologous end joining protein Ku
MDLVKAKEAGRAVQPVATPRPATVINLMDALRRSIEHEKAADQSPRSQEAEAPPQRPAPAAASARDKVRKSPRSKKTR